MDARRVSRFWAAAAMAGVVLGATAGPRLLLGDEPPNRLSRIFRLGGSSRTGSSGSQSSSTGAGASLGTSSSGMAARSASMPPLSAPPSAAIPPTGPQGTVGTRIAPQPRVSRPMTESDPLVTRVSLGRSDDGKQFAMFLQVFADGTVIDGEGVHRVGADLLRPIAQTIQGGDLAKLKGHCGGPAADFIEQVHVVVYDRYLGRLRASSFSYSGNPQGCDPSVKALNTALDAVQNKLSGPPVTGPSSPAAPVAAPPLTESASAPPPPTIGLSPDH